MTESLEEKILSHRWFYDFHLPSGNRTPCYCPPHLLPIHGTRKEMLDSVLDPLIGDAWPDTTCLDLACHEGFFSLALAQKGAKSVLGIDAREENIQHAQWIREVFQQENMRFQAQNVYDIQTESLGHFDVVLVFGLLYHLENPIHVLRVARAMTRRVCLIETQVAPGISPGNMDWGHSASKITMQGSFVVVEETIADVNRESNLDTVSLVPSLDALLWLMKHFGFQRVEVVPCPEGGYEQLVCGSRVMVAGFLE